MLLAISPVVHCQDPKQASLDDFPTHHNYVLIAGTIGRVFRGRVTWWEHPVGEPNRVYMPVVGGTHGREAVAGLFHFSSFIYISTSTIVFVT